MYMWKMLGSVVGVKGQQWRDEYNGGSSWIEAFLVWYEGGGGSNEI